MHIVDEAWYWFRIMSMMTPIVWYNVSLQCSYSDCQDLASKCKHLLQIPMIIKRHMTSLCWSLPFIDHAAQMWMDDITETEAQTGVELAIETEVEPVDMESWKSQLQINEGSYSMALVRVRILRQGCCWRLSATNGRIEECLCFNFNGGSFIYLKLRDFDVKMFFYTSNVLMSGFESGSWW